MKEGELYSVEMRMFDVVVCGRSGVRGTCSKLKARLRSRRPDFEGCCVFERGF